jgi:tetratricopeptide (TPR) repeat protein
LREESETLRRLDDAIQMFQRALDIDSTLAIAWAALGEAYWTRYDRFDRKKEASSRQEAERAVRRALTLDPDLPEAHNACARGLIAEGNYRGAIQELKAALKGNPRFAAAWVNLGRAHQGAGEYADGLAALKRAIRLNPTSFRNYISLGNFHQRSQEYDEAEKAYRKATDLKPDSPIAWRNLGACLLYQGDSERAAHALTQSLNLEENARSRTNLGIAYQYMKRYDLAAEQFRRATELEPGNPNSWSSLGDALTMLGKGEEAKEPYRTAARHGRDRMDAAPLDPSAHSDLAAWCAKAGDLECAISEGAQALAMRPEDVHVLFANALIRCIQGRDDEALELLEKATRLGLGRAEMENDPALLRLHQNPRFLRILELAS